jgi:hypothetical protein
MIFNLKYYLNLSIQEIEGFTQFELLSYLQRWKKVKKKEKEDYDKEQARIKALYKK